RAGDAARAEAIVKDLKRRFPTDTLLNRYWIPSIQAAIEIDRKNPARAIELLQVASPFELGGKPFDFDMLYPVYLRGLAYLMQRDGSAAAAEFSKIPEHSGRVTNCSLGALAHLQLGRAYARSGDRSNAQAAFQAFLALWSDADPDIVVLRQAQVEDARAFRLSVLPRRRERPRSPAPARPPAIREQALAIWAGTRGSSPAPNILEIQHPKAPQLVRNIPRS